MLFRSNMRNSPIPTISNNSTLNSNNTSSTNELQPHHHKSKSSKQNLEDSLSNEQQYSFINFFAYNFYGPLYIGGPILSYNSFIKQVYSPHSNHSIWELFKMTARILIYFAGMEIALHFSYQYAISQYKYWKLFDDGLEGIYTLFILFIYFKILFIS